MRECGGTVDSEDLKIFRFMRVGSNPTTRTKFAIDVKATAATMTKRNSCRNHGSKLQD